MDLDLNFFLVKLRAPDSLVGSCSLLLSAAPSLALSIVNVAAVFVCDLKADLELGRPCPFHRGSERGAGSPFVQWTENRSAPVQGA